MYKVSVPLVRFFERHEENIREAKRLGAERVFLCPGRGLGGEEECRMELARLRENIPIYEAAGFEVGVWISTIGHGGDLVGANNSCCSGFTNIVGIKGGSAGDSFCPLDDAFAEKVCRWVRGIAEAGAKTIMLDDDFRLSTRAGDSWCACKLHMAEYCRRIGENMTREEVLHRAFVGGPNRYRDVWYDLMGDTLRGFARKLRASADGVDPSIRMGACSCITVWDSDGADSIEIARILAGKNRPFIRFIGAAYWPTTWGGACSSLPYVAELERMQRFWCEKENIEVFGEGDVYPRPRHFVPAAYLEAMDTILRADGGFDGILKYGIDYGASPVYETGYADRAERNAGLYRDIETHFADKRCVGISAACEMKKLKKRFIEDASLIGGNGDDGFFQTEQYVLTANSLPVTYGEGADVAIVFGENARYSSAGEKGFILDVSAAKIFEERGIDTGLASAEKLTSVSEELYPEQDEHLVLSDIRGLFCIIPKDGGEVLSEFSGENPGASALRYENAEGKRFLVLGCDAERAVNNRRFIRNYCRQRQLTDCAEWLGRAPLCAVCAKNPELYIMAKRGEGSMAVGLWNVFEDSVLSPEIRLDKAYSRAEFINCSGELCGNTVRLSEDIPPFSFAGFEVFD